MKYQAVRRKEEGGRRRLPFFASLLLTPFFLLLPMFVGAQSVSISFNPGTLTMYVGEAKTVTVTGSNSLYIGSNGNPAVASATFSNPTTLLISSYLEGTDSISVCAYGATGGVSCSALGITVLKNPGNNYPTTQQAQQQQATISFSSNQVTMNVGDSSSVTVNGSGAGSYYVSSNSGSEVVSATVVGSSNTVSLTAQSVGGANITICQFGGTCGTFYAYVPSTASNMQAVQATSHPIPLLSAFYIASNDVGGSFLGPGAALTIKFNTSDSVVLAHLNVAGHDVQLTGSGGGPYAGTYTMTGSEQIPIPISMDFTTGANMTGRAALTVGGEGVPAAVPAAAPTASAFGTFVSSLTKGMTSSEVSALQYLLKKLGFLSATPTGYYGPSTEAAVKKYQSSKGLSPVGFVGPATRAALNKDAAK